MPGNKANISEYIVISKFITWRSERHRRKQQSNHIREMKDSEIWERNGQEREGKREKRKGQRTGKREGNEKGEKRKWMRKGEGEREKEQKMREKEKGEKRKRKGEGKRKRKRKGEERRSLCHRYILPLRIPITYFTTLECNPDFLYPCKYIQGREQTMSQNSKHHRLVTFSTGKKTTQLLHTYHKG